MEGGTGSVFRGSVGSVVCGVSSFEFRAELFLKFVKSSLEVGCTIDRS